MPTLDRDLSQSQPSTTASHRPTPALLQVILFQIIQGLGFTEDTEGSVEDLPSRETQRRAMMVLAQIPLRLLWKPNIDVFCGEIHMQWVNGDKQVVVMCFPSQPTLVHHYQNIPNGVSEHGIELASKEQVDYWLQWMRQ